MARRVQWRDSCRRVLRRPVTGSATAATRPCRRRVPETTGSHALLRTTILLRAASPRRSRSCRRVHRLTHPPRILVLHGSLRETSFSKLANEMARLLEVLGCEVRSFDPSDLPVRDPTIEDHPKVVELRALSEWSEGHVWVSPEMHGCITGAFKNQIDWLPLNTGSVRPTQGRTCVVLQVNGGSQSFNAVWKSTSELGYPEKYCVDLREPPRHRADVATGTMSRRWRGIATPSRRRSYGKHVASMAWGARNLISTQVQRRQRAAEARAVDAHALLHEPKQRSESVEGVRRRRQNEAVGF